MDGLPTAIVNILGLFLLFTTGYFIVTRTFLPQFALPWFGKKRRQRAVETANRLLADDELDQELRWKVERCRNTLLAYDTQPREMWSGHLPAGDAVDEIERIQSEQGTSRT